MNQEGATAAPIDESSKAHFLRNLSLEQVKLGRSFNLQYDSVLKRSNLLLHINHAWNPTSGKRLASNLWPLVLQKAMTLSYYQNGVEWGGPWGKPTLTSPRLDISFWLLKEMVVPHHITDLRRFAFNTHRF